MLVWIVRHGKAEATSVSGRDDDRLLAGRGERQADWLGKQIARRKDGPSRVVSSPIVRAIETARRINAALKAPLETAAGLETGRPISTALALMKEHDGAGPLMLVGHNPQLGKLVGTLVGGHGAEAEMKTGQAVLLDVDRESPLGTAKEIAVLRLKED